MDKNEVAAYVIGIGSCVGMIALEIYVGWVLLTLIGGALIWTVFHKEERNDECCDD